MKSKIQKTETWKNNFLESALILFSMKLESYNQCKYIYDLLKSLAMQQICLGPGYVFEDIKEYECFQEICILRVTEINEHIKKNN